MPSTLKLVGVCRGREGCACVAELLRHAHGVESETDELAREGVPERVRRNPVTESCALDGPFNSLRRTPMVVSSSVEKHGKT